MVLLLPQSGLEWFTLVWNGFTPTPEWFGVVWSHLLQSGLEWFGVVWSGFTTPEWYWSGLHWFGRILSKESKPPNESNPADALAACSPPQIKKLVAAHAPPLRKDIHWGYPGLNWTVVCQYSTRTGNNRLEPDLDVWELDAQRLELHPNWEQSA